jgi:UDP-N-acetylmuramate--alanine ligase
MKYFFSGVGGIGMSSLALYAKDHLNDVYGSNNEENDRTIFLKDKGLKIRIGHNSDIPEDLDCLIKTTAVNEDNPEIISARQKNIKVINRMDYLNEIMKKNFSIGISGTDGKTSTTAMISKIFIDANKNPTIFLGGIHDSLEEGNYRRGNNLIISEVDESDGYVKNSVNDVSVILNLKPDHLEHYNDCFEKLKAAIKNYILNTRKISYINNDDKILKEISCEYKNIRTIGSDSSADYYYKNRKQLEKKQSFEIFHKEKNLGEISLNLPGVIYVYNALFAVAVSLDYGIDFKTIKNSLESFNTVNRRFNILYENCGKFIVDDYAHTPEEILQTIKAAKEFFPNKEIIAIFQPHRYTRLNREFNNFIKALESVALVYVYRIYSAFENPTYLTNEKMIVDKLQEKNIKSEFIETPSQTIQKLEAHSNCVYLFLGAGDITNVAKEYSKYLIINSVTK